VRSANNSDTLSEETVLVYLSTKRATVVSLRYRHCTVHIDLHRYVCLTDDNVKQK